jgi:hypothetical protein
MSGIEFLQKNIGNQRFDTNFIQPNYGSYFNIAQIGINDLPVPKLWCDYVMNNNRTETGNENCIVGARTIQPTDEYINQDKELGVKYLAVSKGFLTKEIIISQKLVLVYEDEYMEIYENTGYRKYLSGDDCEVVETNSFDNFEINCDANSTLTRLELFYPGWHAKVDGEEVDIRKVEDLFQQIDVSQGEHKVEFYYWPKYMTLAIVGSCIGAINVLLLCALVLIYRRKGVNEKK